MRDVTYGLDERNTMDIFVPAELDPAENNGAFILVYGGSWTTGSKQDMQELAQQYARAGYISVAINMRNATVDEATGKTVVTIYDMLDDIQSSIRKLKELSQENGWNITSCALKGYSSGANLAMLYAYSRGADVPWLDTTEIIPVRFVVDLVGPVDMHESAWAGDTQWPEEDKAFTAQPGAADLYTILLTGAGNSRPYEELMQDEAAMETWTNSISPVWYVEQFGGLPTLMGYSVRDVAQNPNNGKTLRTYLEEKNTRNDLFEFPNSIHGHYADPELAQSFFDKSIEYAEEYFC